MILVLSAIPVALSDGVDETNVGGALSKVTLRSVPAALVAEFPWVSLTPKVPEGLIVTTPEVVAVTVMMQ